MIDDRTKLTIKAMIWINVIMYVVSLLFSKGLHLTLNPLAALAPSSNALIFLGASGTMALEYTHDWSSIFTANWLHGSLLHILFNMMALRTLAPLTAKEFGLYRMVSIYILSGAGGFLLSCLGGVPLTIGASAGLCGLIGALFYFGKSRGGIWGKMVFNQTKSWILSLVLIGLILPNINNWGHGGGFAAGFILAFLFGYEENRKSGKADILICAGLSAFTCFLLFRSILQGLELILA
ncbi:rhomboid family intramembrane serine protease [uncultured Desulfobacter sp.]|uniref:rhomboid family intramembrane serine protease n=1 Tax=uncultured Desulfobacter sp. TaxID=240139 RepID=UPI002AAB9D0C|nr:rhomboid family intramembrane serine protease [uncultured Desulfobacter sp.]